jgi:hypothetical protein
VQLGVWEDLGLVAAGGLTLAVTLLPLRQLRPAPSCLLPTATRRSVSNAVTNDLPNS